jgi:phosphate/sulfate permease
MTEKAPTPQADEEPKLDAVTAAKAVPQAAAVAAQTVRSKVSSPPPPVLIAVGAALTLGILLLVWQRVIRAD